MPHVVSIYPAHDSRLMPPLPSARFTYTYLLFVFRFSFVRYEINPKCGAIEDRTPLVLRHEFVGHDTLRVYVCSTVYLLFFVKCELNLTLITMINNQIQLFLDIEMGYRIFSDRESK